MKIYFVDYPTHPSKTELEYRVSQTGHDQVLAGAENIDIIIADEIEHDKKIQKWIDQLKTLHNAKLMTSAKLLKQLGYAPDSRFINWETYSNFDPWTGEKINLWDDSKLLSLEFELQTELF